MPITIEQLIAPLVGVAFGWVLSEIGQRRRASAAQRSAAGRALADLLEIRYYLVCVEATFAELKKRWPISEDDLNVVTRAMGLLIPGDTQLSNRYNDAVSEIAAFDPLLAFRLRSRDQIPGLLSRIRAFRLPSGGGLEAPAEAEAFLRGVGLEALDDAAQSIAWAHGIVTWIRVKHKLSRRPAMPREFQEWIKLVEGKSGTPSAPGGT